jgi:hypothetical protein
VVGGLGANGGNDLDAGLLDARLRVSGAGRLDRVGDDRRTERWT